MGLTLCYLGFVFILPFIALAISASRMSLDSFLVMAILAPRVQAAYRLSLGSASLAALLISLSGFMVAWVLVRYRFPGRSLLDASVDIPFALPTAVSGIALTTLYARTGWVGRYFDMFGIQIAYARPGIVIALMLIGLPFIVRTLQPAIMELDIDQEAAAASLGASPAQTFFRVSLPCLLPSILTAFSLSLARGLGEFGSIYFIAGNLPFKTEIAPLLIIMKLEQYDYEGATAIGLVMLALSFVMFLLLFLPLILIFHYAFAGGVRVVLAALRDPDSLAAIRLTLMTAAIVVPINTLFGIIMAWSIAKFEFRGKTALITILDIPFAISPVVVGMMLILLFGNRGLLGPWLQSNNLRIIFNTPGIILATLFVTFPFVARELIPLMQSQGVDDEYAALSLGASGLATFFRVTLPNIKWSLMYGILLTNARAMGEFGAVSVVSGHIRGRTNTIPLQVEILYNDYQLSAAFAVAGILVLAALLTLIVKYISEIRQSAMEKS